LELAYIARRAAPRALIVAGGMEATFRPELMFELGPFDLVILGEGERPLLELVARLGSGQSVNGMMGTAQRGADGKIICIPQRALNRDELRDAIYATPYENMPYAAYWERLEAAYRVGSLPSKAAREAQLAEIRSVRLITLNYCPMNCTFCSATNFLHEAQNGVARLARLDADECMTMIERIVAAHPGVRTIIFQDDIFTFTRDQRILPLCDAIVAAKHRGRIPAQLQFISTNRIDAMSNERLAAMSRAGFRVLGFGIENFSQRVLAEFNKAQIHRHIEPMLSAALANGITPFLDIILSSPRATLDDVAETLRCCYQWLRKGCEIGVYPYVIPFSGAAFSRDPSLLPHTRYLLRQVAGTSVAWEQAAKILPIDPVVKDVIVRMEHDFEEMLGSLGTQEAHLPSRVRSILWILSATPILAEFGHSIADEREIRAELRMRLPRSEPEAALLAAAGV
ncbi:MAG TPA: radical SAM protein, partial [Steroidobacteraceae bacterium]